MISPDLLRQLRGPGGEALLHRAAQLTDDPFVVQKLRGDTSAELVAAAVELLRLRARAAVKFSRAGEMWLSPSLLEQSTGELIANHRARRFASWSGEWVGDFCCGLGSDAVALARFVRVLGVDRDPLALALTAANAEVFGVRERLQLALGELPAAAPRVRAAWVDPGRRENGRTRGLSAISPTLGEILELRKQTPNLGIKLSPATADSELDSLLRGIPHERELISVSGECREMVLWLGELARLPGGANFAHRASLLPSGEALAGMPEPFPPARAPEGWLLEPDPAVIRAGLVGNLARQLGAWPIDERLAYLSVSEPPRTPFARAYRIGMPEPFSGKALSAGLRRMGAGDVVLKTRGSVLQPEVVRQQLRGVLKQGSADCRPVVFLTRLAGRAVMIWGERIGSGRN